jgi:hypothetical protein
MIVDNTATEAGSRFIQIQRSQLRRHPKPSQRASLPRLPAVAALPLTKRRRCSIARYPTAPPPAPRQLLPPLHHRRHALRCRYLPAPTAQIPLRRRPNPLGPPKSPFAPSLPARPAPPTPSSNTALSARTRGGASGGCCAAPAPLSPLPLHRSSHP